MKKIMKSVRDSTELGNIFSTELILPVDFMETREAELNAVIYLLPLPEMNRVRTMAGK